MVTPALSQLLRQVLAHRQLVHLRQFVLDLSDQHVADLVEGALGIPEVVDRVVGGLGDHRLAVRPRGCGTRRQRARRLLAREEQRPGESDGRKEQAGGGVEQVRKLVRLCEPSLNCL